MADIFKPEEMMELLKQKKVLIIGDSNTRGLYKDLLWLSENCSFLPQNQLKGRLEKSFCGDRLVEGEKASRGRDFREMRHFHTANSQLDVRFVFCTRIFSPYLRQVLDRYRREPPDLIIVNSCVWDISSRSRDGIHWNPRATRTITNLLLTHICLSWNRALPGRGPRLAMQRRMQEAHLTDEQVRELTDVGLSGWQVAAARTLRGDLAPGPR